MIIFLYGQDNFRSQEKLNKIIRRFKEYDKSGFNLELFDGEDLEFGCFKNSLISSSFFGSKKLIIIKNLLTKGSADLLEKINEYGSQWDRLDRKDKIIVFWEKGEPDKRTKLFKLLKRIGKCQEFRPLENYQINNWIEKEVKRKKSSISPEAQKKLVAFIGSNLWQMKNEIDKLVFYKLGKIESNDVDLLVVSSITSNVFNIVDALGNKNQKKALKFLHEQLEKGENAIYLFSMIVYQFRNLIKIKSVGIKYRQISDLAKIVGLHPYVVQKTVAQTKKFSLSELKEKYQKLLDLDLAIKIGKMEPITALDLFVA